MLNYRVDYMYISPELQALLMAVELDDTIWPDHRVLQAKFRGTGREIPRFVWKQPKAVEWPQFHFDPIEPIAPGKATKCYADMWHQIEAETSNHSKTPIPSGSRDRAQTLAPKKVIGHALGPMKAPRAGELIPAYTGMPVQHAHWYRQARRLQAYVRFGRSRRPDVHPCPCHAANVCGAIKRSKGFTPDFATW